jgi:hypothetical protein
MAIIGLIVSMFYGDTRKHHLPHIHVNYQEDEAVFEIPNGNLLTGALPPKKIKLVQAWIALHEEELMVDWKLATTEENIFRIDPLK